ncbi:MAG: hypothetical protein CME62_06940 [Halobacteriovoraceae bacterium]|nr:hypothetical protein [Halobacteriovoraceae bacterium]|tara:strand:- start:9721 stop:10500 length:780 start_codon:yes stop_codon:yes gene_type:complete
MIESLILGLAALRMEILSDFNYTVKENIKYATHERNVGDLYLTSKKNAGIIYVVHGGSWSGRDKTDMNYICKSLASHGYNVFNINYRLAPENKHPAPVEDLSLAINFISKKYKDDINISNSGIWGYSAGAHIGLLYALTHSDKVKAFVGGGGPYDFLWWPKSPIITPYMGYSMDSNMQGWLEASPVHYIHRNAPQMFLYHGGGDELVEHSQMTHFAAQAKLKGVDVRTFTVSDYGHVKTFLTGREAIVKGLEFIQQNVN